MKANMCRKQKCLTSAPARLSVAMPLILGLATIAAAPTVGAVTVREVDINDGFVDVNENGSIDATDDLSGVALWCNDATPVRVGITDGFVNVDEQLPVGEATDDLIDCDLNDENGDIPSRNQVDILDGTVDVDEDGILNEAIDDDIANVQLFVLP